MACCAFAVFLLMRLLAPFRAAARRLGLRSAVRMDAAVAWRPGVSAPAMPIPALTRPLWRRLLALEAALLALLAGPAVASSDNAAHLSRPDPAIVALIHKNICKPLGWRN